jgi:putative hydrolase
LAVDDFLCEERILMIELHSHSMLSDGALLPTEALRRAVAEGFEAYAITDHVDTGSLERVISELMRISKALRDEMRVQFIPGVELTHIPPQLIRDLVRHARRLGAQLVLAHGETVVEPVAPGTNRAALEAGCDILAHPGLITPEDAHLAADKGIYLELSGRRGHCLANGHVARLARDCGARLVINSDTHEPVDTMGFERRRIVGLGAGLSESEVNTALENMRTIATKCLRNPVVL